jgi:hypothetical protein
VGGMRQCSSAGPAEWFTFGSKIILLYSQTYEYSLVEFTDLVQLWRNQKKQE